jgi:hypothetical protein
MDYENLSRPPPAPTEEATQSLEDIIKRRIAEARSVGEGGATCVCVRALFCIVVHVVDVLS